MFAFIRRSPLVIICIFFIVGILIEFQYPITAAWTCYAFALVFFCCLWFILRKKSPPVQTSFILILSFFLGLHTVNNFTRRNSTFQNQRVEIQFQIEKQLRLNQYVASADNQEFLVELKNMDSLQVGDELLAKGTFLEISHPKLPWLFNQKKQMLANGITLQFQVDTIKQSSSKHRSSIKFLPQQIQKHLQQKITKSISDSSSAAILSALLLGETSLLSKETTVDYSVAGVVHILAVSGMHVALIYQLILLILKLLFRKKRKWLTFILAMTLLWGYGAITGFSASVVRACCMFSFFVISDCFLLSRNTANTIAGSTILILYFQPFLIFNLGFLLSITAVLGIVVIHPIILRHFYTENKIAYYLISSSSITLSAQIATLPITLYIFHSFPTYFISANLILVPWSSLILYIGIAFIFFSEIPIFGNLITQLLDLTTSGMNQFIHLIHYLPHAQLSEINFNFEQALTTYAFLFTIFLIIIYKWKQAIHCAGALTLLFIFFSYKTPANTGVIFTYYKSNLMLIGTESQLILACNNDSLAKKYASKISMWKCQQNRAAQQIKHIPFPTYFSWNESQNVFSIGTFRHRKKVSYILLNDELKKHKIDSTLLNEFQHEKTLIGQGVSKKKKEIIKTSLTERNLPFQNLQSHPFNIK
jgi:competence protein ComEC